MLLPIPDGLVNISHSIKMLLFVYYTECNVLMVVCLYMKIMVFCGVEDIHQGEVFGLVQEGTSKLLSLAWNVPR